MSYWQTPNVSFAKPEEIYSSGAGMFLASMQAAGEARRRKQELELRERERLDRESQFARELTERYQDNERESWRIQTEDERARELKRQELEAKAAEEKARIERERQKDAAGAIEKVQEAVEGQNPNRAAVIAGAHGVEFGPYRLPEFKPPEAPEALKTEEGRRAVEDEGKVRTANRALPMVSPLGLPMFSPFSLAGMGTDAGLAKEAEKYVDVRTAAENEREGQEKAAQGMYQAFLPNGKTLLMSSSAETEARAARAKIGAEIVQNMAPLADTPIKREALKDVYNVVSNGALPPDKDAIAKAWTDRVSELERLEQAERSSIRTASAMRNRQEKLTEPERVATAKASRLASIADQLYALPPLSKEASETILQHLADEAYFEANPGKKAIAMRTGAYKDISEKLQGTDLKSYYLSLELTTDVLRKETGAVIQPNEWQNVMQRYIRLPGDDDDVAALKQGMLYDKIDEIAGASRAGYGGKAPRQKPGNPEALKDALRNNPELLKQLLGGGKQ